MARERFTGTMIDSGPYRVPPTRALIAFESAARQGSISRAAEELHTAQPAISRYISSLEKHLAVKLFERTRTGVSLTEAGRRYREAVLIGLGALQEAGAEVLALAGAGPPEVTIACPDEVSHLFAMQRYDALRVALGEEVGIRNLAHADAHAPPQSGPAADVLLTRDAESAAPRQRAVIAREAVAAFCSPGYAAAHADVLDGPVAGWGVLTFLSLAESDDDGPTWERWFEAAGRPLSAPRYEAVGSHAHALKEAVAGRGLVLGWRHLIGRYVATGTLVMQGSNFVETGRHLHAVLTAKGREKPHARAFYEATEVKR